MDCQPAQARLSPFMDGELPEGEARELKAHLGACGPCSKILEDLRSVSRMVRELPKAALPAGFLGRLSRRRQGARKPEDAWALAASPRAWAFAMTAVLAGVVVYRTGGPEAPPEIPMTAALAPEAPAAGKGPAALSAAAGALGDSRPLAAPAGARLKPKAVSRPARDYSNEAQNRRLQEERETLGIRAIGAEAQEEDSGPEPLLGYRLGQPTTRRQAEIAIRQFAAMRRAVDESAGKGRPVALDGRTARILAEKEGPRGGSVEAGRVSEDSWAGQFSEGNEGTRTITDAESWRELWRSLSREPAPSIDFSRRQVVAVFLGHRQTGGYRVEISAVKAGEAFITVEYRETAPEAGRSPPEGPTSPFALKIIPKNPLPVRFERAGTGP